MSYSNAPWPVYEDDEVAAVETVLRSGKVNYWTGSVSRDFEKDYAAYVGVPHDIAVANGTVALDLGFAPPANAYLAATDLKAPEGYFPLKLYVCDECWLVQTEDYSRADELFRPDYAYFSSISKGWLQHAARYVEDVTARLGLDRSSHVIEVASNDGYLLRNFVAAGIPCLGIEPTDSTAAAAEAQGIPVMREFFGKQLAQRLVAEGRAADLVLGNNVYAHVPDINDFTAGLEAE